MISFTAETDGRLPSGQPLGEAITEVDAATGGARLLHAQLRAPDPLRGRARGAVGAGGSAALRANASSEPRGTRRGDELDAGDPADLAQRYVGLKERLPA